MTPPTLQELALKHTCERAWTHSYLPDYEEVLGHLRDQPVMLLEIGIGLNLKPVGPDGQHLHLPAGAGLRMWADFFPNGRILGVDAFDCGVPSEGRVTVLPTCRQEDPQLVELVRPYAPIDIVIDDASHNRGEQHACYGHLRPLLKPGGFYFVEDVEADDQIEAWTKREGYERHWARHQQGPGGPHRQDDILILLRG